MDTLLRVKMRCWKSQYPTLRKLPCSSSVFSLEIKRKLIARPVSFVSPPSCSLSMSPKVDEKQSDSDILSTVLPESDSVLVHVRFVLQKECVFGERFYLVGDNPLLGLWDPSKGIPLDWSEGHVWSAQLDLPSNMKVEFKFVLLDLSGEVQWQPGTNRVLTLNQVFKSLKREASTTITVQEDWDSADNQTISLEDVAVSEDASFMQDKDCNDNISDVSNETENHPASTQGNNDSGIVSRTGLENSKSDSNSNSRGVTLVPGLSSEKTDAHADDCMEHLETEDENHCPGNEINIEGNEDKDDKGNDGAGLNISSEKEISQPITNSILQNDLQLGQRAVQDIFPTTSNILRNDLQWGQRVLQGIFSSLGFDS